MVQYITRKETMQPSETNFFSLFLHTFSALHTSSQRAKNTVFLPFGNILWRTFFSLVSIFSTKLKLLTDYPNYIMYKKC